MIDQHRESSPLNHKNYGKEWRQTRAPLRHYRHEARQREQELNAIGKLLMTKYY